MHFAFELPPLCSQPCHRETRERRMRVTDAAAGETAAAHLIAPPALSGRASAVVIRAIDAVPAELHDFAFRYGQCYDAYLATEPGRSLFWSSDRQGLLSYVRRNRIILVGGGLLAPPEHKERLLREFVAVVARERLRVIFHNICTPDLGLFRQHGFQVTKWGEEPIIDLTTCTWSG